MNTNFQFSEDTMRMIRSYHVYGPIDQWMSYAHEDQLQNPVVEMDYVIEMKDVDPFTGERVWIK